MLKRFFRAIHYLLFAAVIVALTAFNTLLFWVATGPRSLDAVTPYLEAALNSDSFNVKIDHTLLLWDGWKHPIEIRLHGVSVLTKSGQIFSSFPEIEMGISVWHLPLGQVLPTSITIHHPAINLYQNDDRSISLGFQPEPDASKPETPAAPADADNASQPFTVPVAAIVQPLFSNSVTGNFSKLHYVTISDATATISSASKHAVLQAKNVNIALKREHDGVVQIRTSIDVAYDKYTSSIKSQFQLTKDQPAIGQVSFTGVMPSALIALFSDDPALAGVHLPVDGKLDMSCDQGGKVQRVHFDLKGGSGVIHTDKLAGDLNVNSLSVTGQVSDNFNNIQLDNFSADINKAQFTASGLVIRQGDDVSLRGDADIKNANGVDVKLYWPPSVSPESREWVTTNITGGKVQEAKAHIDIKFGDLAKPILPKEDIDAVLTLQGAKIRYLPEHPEITNVNGQVHIDGTSLTADITGGDFLKATKLTGGHLDIADLNADNPHIVVNFEADTTAKDAVNFLKLPRVNHAARLNLNADTADGTAHVKGNVGFDFYAPKDAKGKSQDADIDYDVTADMKGITEPGFMNRFDIKGANGQFTINNTQITYKGAANVNGADISDSNIKYLFKPENGFDTFIEATAVAPAESLPKFNYPDFTFLKGKLGVKINLKQGDTKEVDTASIDLTNTDVNWGLIGLVKPDKEPATLELAADKQDGQMRISSFHMKGRKIDITGSALLNKEFNNIQNVTLGKTVFGKNNLDKLYFEFTDGGFNLQANGESADATPFVKHDQKQPGSFSFEHFPAVHSSGEVDHLFLSDEDGHELQHVEGTLDCDTTICESANISGTAGDKPFSFRILRNPTGKRQLSLHAENAGAFLRAVNVIDGMQGGDMTITGNYEEGSASGKGNSTLKGKIDITEYTVKDAPILGKILSLASFTGVIDTLQGNGIRFVKLTAPFILSDDVIAFEDAKTHGPSIGLTMDGTITFPAGTLNLEGTVVPAYTVNSFFGKVPLVGSALTGGEGGGVFAAKYSVKGTQSAPDVSVNPLSILTPGFLRGIFDIFDTPVPERAKEEMKENAS